ncbi:MAG TPA: ANTAR domain-containing protein [Solirubrobacteraceae bacterium]|nr:ANTAR domain-containing protein [Solirubrobacteraceae bacterium]
MTTQRNLRVLIANEDREALNELGTVLQSLGHEVAPYVVSVAEAIELIGTEDPDLAIVVVHHDDDHALALIQETVEYASGPVIAQTRDNNVEFVARAAERGISAWIEKISPEVVQGAIEVALRRYEETQRLETKVEQLESALDRRAIIERAKGILMERHALDDRAAFELLRDHARSQSRRVVDVARTVTEGHALLPPRAG